MITNITQDRAHQHSNVHKRKFEALSGKTQGAFIRNGVEIGLAAVAHSLLVDSTFKARWMERTKQGRRSRTSAEGTVVSTS